MKDKKLAIFRGIAAVMAVLMLITVSASNLMFEYSGAINQALNISTSRVISTDTEDADTDYYTSEFGADYTNKQEAMNLELAVAAENVSQAEEGMVLLRNENTALPMSADSQITIFGNGAVNGNISTSAISSIEPRTFAYAMQTAFGEGNVNTVLCNEVYANLEATSNTEVVEADINDVKAHEDSWKDAYNDAAVVVLTRTGGESSDEAMYHSDGTHFLGLAKNEKDLMEYLKEQKDDGIFDKIVVILNTEYQMELDWLDDYEVDACIQAGIPGAVGYEGLANLMIGEANPSGKLVDTYATNSLSAPAVTYAAENTQIWGNVDEVNATCTDITNGGIEIDAYVIYAEGIYVGYKYYETRYEDSVLGEGNATSTMGSSTDSGWNYADEITYPFGYGLSYTTFDQELSSVTYDEDSDTYTVSVAVTNTGDVAGKSVVEVYTQTPYGDYEKENTIEKAAVALAGFGKTETLEPGASETVDVEVDGYFLASYDSNGAKGYILSSGDYYLAIGDDAHDALNNILAAKGYTSSDGMTADGDASKTYTWSQADLDAEKYRYSDTGKEVTNEFDNADLNYYGVDFTYLSRSDWEGTYPETPMVVNATAEMMTDLDTDWYEIPEDAPAVSDFEQGADNGLSFIDMKDVDYDDDEMWDQFLDQLTVDQMTGLMPDTFGVEGIDSINMPSQARTDDAMGGFTLVSTGEPSLSWISEVTTCRTWNEDMYSNRGRYLGIEAAFCGENEIWYGGGNTHRTPFGGRANIYHSEDGYIGYTASADEAEAMQAEGINYGVKHFALNDQETNRESLNTFATEQAIREIYLRPFEGAAAGGALSIMTSFNKIGVTYTAASVNLLTDVLRGEWGFKGHVTTDGFSKSSLYKTHYMEMVTAGLDFVCLDPGEVGAAVKAAIEEDNDGYMMECLRRSAKVNVYATVNGVGANGIASGSVVVSTVPWWETAMLVATLVFALGFIVCTIGFIVALAQEGKKKKEGEEA